jgi:hypothetical protein
MISSFHGARPVARRPKPQRHKGFRYDFFRSK